MARRPGPARPTPKLGKAPPRFTAPFAITWRQVFAVWLVGTLIVVAASWRIMPRETEKGGQMMLHLGGVAWAHTLLHANRFWPGWMPLMVPRPRLWPGFDPRLMPKAPMARPKPKPGQSPTARPNQGHTSGDEGLAPSPRRSPG